MPSFKTAVLAVATAFVASVRADYYIVPTSVPVATREEWCSSEVAECPSICEDMGAGGAKVNTCDSTTLSYGCLCDDNTTPNVSEYSLTLPYFVCTEWGNQCVTACGINNTCASACRQDHPCGALDPTTNKTNSTATASASSTSSTSSSGSDTVYSSLNGKSAAGPPAFEMARLYSTMAVLGLFCVGFGYLL
ncbi:hypothetical protein M406DRAFT_278023 [Cryphonectria parasitica EP155]|uniref:DUF7707 domain-containing protein n=1 Tax=Cryphonectria parasitica (strain ATCC 38755 / EP155) TaxID=660469 RepID=A0A9P4Y0X6_CRYP1|nr:uncharacterized protein M406DRAFT_278023 [Cryphonectria parasitica EP155]KAF3764489.1 hypothetical protein M406DRAFT_278023 [Cryphonectria parasitica EP155]